MLKTLYFYILIIYMFMLKGCWIKSVVAILYILLIVGNLSAQTDSVLIEKIKYEGEINVFTPPSFAILLDKYKQNNYTSPGLEGFRLQIFIDSGNNAKERATAMLNEFQQAYPNIQAYLVYQQPNFKVRIGNFKTGAEARKTQLLLKQSYPSSFIVKDFIQVIQAN